MESSDNIVKYLISPDLWDYPKDYFEKIQEILKREFILFNISLNKTLGFYEYLNSENIDLTFSNYNNDNEIIDNNNNNIIDNSFASPSLNNDVQNLVDNNIGFDDR